METVYGVLGILGIIGLIGLFAFIMFMAARKKTVDPRIDFRRKQYFDEVHDKAASRKAIARILKVEKPRALAVGQLAKQKTEDHSLRDQNELSDFFSDDEEEGPDEISMAYEMDVEITPQNGTSYIVKDGCPGHKSYSGWWVFQATGSDVLQFTEAAWTGNNALSLPVVIHPTDPQKVYFEFEIDYWQKHHER